MMISAVDFLHERMDLVDREIPELLRFVYFRERAEWLGHLTKVANQIGVPNYFRNEAKELQSFIAKLRSLVERALYIEENGFQIGDRVKVGQEPVTIVSINRDWTITVLMPNGKKRTRYSPQSVRKEKVEVQSERL